MNYDEIKKTGVNRIEVSDSLNAPLLQLRVKPNANTLIPESNDLVIQVDNSLTNVSNRKNFTYKLSSPLHYLNNVADELIIEPTFKGNKISMESKVIRRISPSYEYQNILVGDDLSGVKLSLNLSTLKIDGKTVLLKTDKYRILDHYYPEEEVIVIQKFDENNNDYTLETILYRYSNNEHAILQELKEYTLPEDFGVVTEVCWDPGSSLEYIAPQYQKEVKIGNMILDQEETETLAYQPIVLSEGINTVSANYENIEINLVYPKNTDLMKYFLANTYTYALNNEDKFLTLDDLYFKDSFTEVDTNVINALFNKLTIKCMNSANNKFSLDCDGNLNLAGIVASSGLSTTSISSKNNKFSLDSEGNLFVNKITTNIPITSGGVTFSDIYPVGSIYMSVNGTNPSSLFGGTWKQLKDRFLLGAGNTYQNGSKGGEASHNLSANEIPKHKHSFNVNTSSSGAHRHEVFLNGDPGFPLILWPGWGNNGTSESHLNTDQGYGFHTYTDSTGSHAHNVSGNTSEIGSSKSHNNMPPYLTVYMWQRTA